MIAARRTAMVLPACCALALGACGGDDEEPPPAADPAPAEQKAPAAGGGEACRDVKVPGHQAIDLKASGVACAAAEKVAAAAEGRARAPYESGGFACQPSDASGGDTNYSCSMGAARITFLYGTV